MSILKLQRSFLYCVLLGLMFLCLLPFLMMLINSTRSASEILSGFTLIPGNQLGANLRTVAEHVNVWRGMVNSATISVSVIILTGYFASLTAYGFEFYDFRGKKLLFGLVLIMMMVPGQLGLIGFYDLNFRLGFLDTYIPLILPAVASSGAMFFIRQYMASTIHQALIDAARIDGCKELTIFHTIVFPLSLPAVSTMAIMAFIGSWNSYLVPLILITSPEKKTLPLAVTSLRGSRVATINQGAIYAAIAISVLPVVLVFVLFSRYIISGISAGSVKG